MSDRIPFLEQRISTLRKQKDRYKKRIAELEAQIPSWIPVSERLPATDEWVVFLDGNNSLPLRYWIDKIDKHGDCLCNYLHNYTHWMPLSAPGVSDASI